jgi:hypothetical protein
MIINYRIVVSFFNHPLEGQNMRGFSILLFGLATGLGIIGTAIHIHLGNLHMAALMVGMGVVLSLQGVGAAILSKK